MYNVLLVDDEPMVTDGMSRFFNWEESGFTVVATATSVARALTFLEGNDVDLVITDVNMPVQNGIDLIRILKEEYPNIKTIILSGYSEFSYAQSALRLGALDYLTKPVNFQSLKSVLSSAKELLDKMNSKDDISNLLKNTLLLNFINGYPYDEEKAGTILDTKKPIFVAKLSVEHDDMTSVIDRIKEEYRNVTVLSAEENSNFLIFEDVDDENTLRLSLSHLIMDYQNVSIGLSGRGDDYSALRTLSLEAMKALKCQYATGRAGIMSYSQVQNQYIDIEKHHESIIKEMIEILSSSDKRDSAIDYYVSTLLSIGGDLSYQKRFSTEMLVEINLAMKNYDIDSEIGRDLLSSTLIDAAKASGKDDLATIVSKYLASVVEALDKRDGSMLDGELSERVKAYINIHYSENLSLSTLADFFYVSPVYLSRVFKKKTGTNYIDYLTHVRIEKAKEYLEDKSMKVYSIPPLVGYDNPRYFNQLFKEIVGMTPSEYRESKIK